MGINLLLGSHYSEFSTFIGTFVSMVSLDLQQIQIFHDLRSGEINYNYSILVANIFIILVKSIIFICTCSLATNLYKCAMEFETGHSAPGPDKVALYTKIDEM
jgi:Na+-translocating ferredoxin:NAD+ oxidoreductase RnfD subunit